MPQSHVDIEWTIVENDAEWKRLHDWSAATVEVGSAPALGYSRFRWRVAALLCVMVLVNGWTWQPTQHEQLQTVPVPTASTPMSVDRTTVDLIGWLTYPVHPQTDADWQRQFALEDELLWRSLWPHESINQLTTDYQVLEQQGDRLVVNLSISTTFGQQAYRQTRFYRQQTGGWQRIAPEESLWGTPQRLTTPSFVITFRARDMQTVTAVAPQLERLYTTIRRNFGLPLTPPEKKLLIDISVTQRPGAPSMPASQPGTLRVASPALYLAPVDVTDEQLLAQSVALLLVDHLLRQVAAHDAIPAPWQPLEKGLRLWQLWDLALPLATWQDAVVQWLYIAMPATDANQKLVMPRQYTALCQAHQLWMANPWQINIPLWCNSQQRDKVSMLWWGQRHPPVRLAQLVTPVPPHEYAQTASIAERTAYPGQTVALATLIEYAVATYGHESLPTLLTGLRQHESWTTLIPATYGVTPAEFEAGWQRYLVSHYGVSLETITR